MSYASNQTNHNNQIPNTKYQMGFTNQSLVAFLSFALVLLVLGLIGIPTSTNARPLDHHNVASFKEMHERWMRRYGRVYKDELEKQMRLNIFKKNVEYIQKININKTELSSYKSLESRLNAFVDLSNEEFVATYTGYTKPTRNESVSMTMTYNESLANDLPSSVDWRNSGAVTSIKYQGSCGINYLIFSSFIIIFLILVIYMKSNLFMN